MDRLLGPNGDGLGFGSNIEPSHLAVRGQKHSSFMQDKENVPPCLSEWSLEGSQIQIIVNRDLTLVKLSERRPPIPSTSFKEKPRGESNSVIVHMYLTPV